MTFRENMAAALECRKAERAPLWDLSVHFWDSATRRHIVLGEEFEALDSTGKERALHSNAEIMLDAARMFHWSAVSTPGNYWHQAPGQLAYFILPPDARVRQIELLRKLAGDEIMINTGTGGVLFADYSEEFCYKLFDAPQEIDEMARRTLRQAVESARRFRDAGADIVITASDIADNSGPFFSPPQMRRFILPYLNEWAESCRAMGLYTIMHSDGKLTAYLNDIADTAVHALQALDPVAGMDIVEAKKTAGDRLCLCGNIDCGELLTGPPEKVYESTTSLLKSLGDAKGWVLGASNAVQKEVPVEHYRAMIRAWEDYYR